MIGEGLRVESLLLHIKGRQLKWLGIWFGHLVRMSSTHLPREVFRTMFNFEEALRHTIGSWLACGQLGVPWEDLEEVAGEREI